MFRKSLAITAFLSMSFFSSANMKITYVDARPDVQVSISVAKRCQFSGWVRLENEVQIHVTCNKIKSFVTYIDDGIFTNYAIQTGTQEEPVLIRIYKKSLMNSTGLDWETISKSLNKNRQITSKE
jgi:hypothetical protein